MIKFICILLAFMAGLPALAENVPSVPMNESESRFYLNLYNEYKDKDLTKALAYAEKYLEKSDSVITNKEDADLLVKVAKYYQDTRFVFSKAIEYAERACPYYEANGYEEELADSYLMLANLNQMNQNYDMTLKYCNLALKIYKKDEARYISDILYTYNLLGIVHIICDDLEQAEKYFLLLFNNADKAKDNDGLVLALNNLASIGIKNGDTLECETFLKEAVNLSRSRNELRIRSLRNLAAYYYIVGDIERFGQYIDSIKVNAVKINDLADYHNLNAIYYLSKSDTSVAISEYKKSLEYYSQGEFNAKQKQILYELSGLYKELGDIDTAYKYLYEYNQIPSGTDSKMYQRLFNYQNKLNLQAEAEKQSERKAHFTRMLVLIISSCVIILLLASIIYFRKYYIISKKEVELENRKKANDKLSKEINSRQNIIEKKRLQEFKEEMLVNNIYENLKELNAEISEPKTKQKLNMICKELIKLNDHEENEDDVDESKYLPEFNTELIKNLSAAFPNLSMNERRLCAMLNLNMSTKEIADITKQSQNTINISRYRLRKKLGITNSDISIHKFLDKFN